MILSLMIGRCPILCQICVALLAQLSLVHTTAMLRASPETSSAVHAYIYIYIYLQAAAFATELQNSITR
jgi:hypothetical protein